MEYKSLYFIVLGENGGKLNHMTNIIKHKCNIDLPQSHNKRKRKIQKKIDIICILLTTHHANLHFPNLNPFFHLIRIPISNVRKHILFVEDGWNDTDDDVNLKPSSQDNTHTHSHTHSKRKNPRLENVIENLLIFALWI